MNRVVRYRTPHLLGISLTSIFIGILAITWSLPSNTPQQSDLKVENETQALQVESTGLKGNSLRILLKNISLKNITGYKVAIADGFQVTKEKELGDGNEAIRPGEIDEFQIVVSPHDQLNIRILSAIFDDGSADGNAKAATELTSRRLGMKIQLSRILPLLKKALDSSDADMPAAISRLKLEISALDIKPDNAVPFASEAGLHTMKQLVLAHIKELELATDYGSTELRQKLAKLQKRYTNPVLLSV